MNRVLSNLLIVCALALCVLAVAQWKREAELRQSVRSLSQTKIDHEQELGKLQEALRRSEADVLRLDGKVVELKRAEDTNKLEIVKLRRNVQRAETEADGLKEHIEEYKKAIERQNAAIRKQSADTEKQNEVLKKLIEDREKLLGRYNARVQKGNELVMKFNEMSKLIEEKKIEELWPKLNELAELLQSMQQEGAPAGAAQGQ
jgi:chromosome segregation ATPase